MNPLDIAAKAEGVSPEVYALAKSIYMQESGGGKNTNTSNAGAMGGMQVIPSTYEAMMGSRKGMGNPVMNATAGLRYIGEMLKAGGGDPRLAAIGYYGGPGAIRAAKRGEVRVDPRNPKAPNTFQYADQVLARMRGIPSAPRAQAVQEVPLQVAAVQATQEQAPAFDFLGENASAQQTTMARLNELMGQQERVRAAQEAEQQMAMAAQAQPVQDTSENWSWGDLLRTPENITWKSDMYAA